MSRKQELISAIIVAGGKGTRLGAGIPKAFVKLRGTLLFEYSVRVFLDHNAVSEVILVVPGALLEKAEKIVRQRARKKPVILTAGGSERWESVRNGLAATDARASWVLVHDAARPFVTAPVIDSLLKKRKLFPCIITATPVTDTIRRFKDDRCEGTIDRAALIRVGTPQAFKRAALLDALHRAPAMKKAPTDDAQLLERRGIEVGLAWGDPLNFKITTPQDLAIAESLLTARKV
jgi:2-C-methyl-D-erythritol 4-phosphate cytidylyltransferase